MAEDDKGHSELIKKNLQRAGLTNRIIQFSNGKEILDYLFDDNHPESSGNDCSYLLLLDIRMPIKDGIEVLRTIKSDPILKSIPAIMITTTDNPVEIKKCHELGCNSYITKPIDYQKFVETLHNLGLFLKIVAVPTISRKSKRLL